MLSISMQKKVANLYSSLLNNEKKNFETRTIFVVNQQKPTSIINDFSNIFLKEKTPNFISSQTLRDLKVTGKIIILISY